MPHRAILLAGGKSSRMGRDKAALLIDGVPLWQRQLATLRATEPDELCVSGPLDGPYVASGVPMLPDAWPGCGPLGGLATALQNCPSAWLLALAVDMPRMPAHFLRGLVDEAMRTGRGVVARTANGHWEPLGAVYPRDVAAIAEEMLQKGERRMEAFVRELMALGRITPHELTAEDEAYFENWNSPADLPAGLQPD